MTESSNQLPDQDRTPARRRSFWRIVRWPLLGLLVLSVPILLRLAWYWYLSEPSRQLVISRETTYLEGPLSPDGYVDYVAALNATLSEGVTPENNCVALLAQAIGPDKIPDGMEAEFFERLGIPAPALDGRFLLDEPDFVKQRSVDGPPFAEAAQQLEQQRDAALERPWTRDEYPELAALIDRNSEVLAMFVEASRRDRCYAPLIAGNTPPYLISVSLPIELEQRDGIRQLAVRAMARLAEGDAASAWDDLLTCHRQSRLTGDSPFLIGMLVAIALDAIAMRGDQALINSPHLSAEQARQCVRDLQALRSRRPMVELVDQFERLVMLDGVIGVARGAGGAPGGGPAGARPAIMNGAIDWNVPLRLMNEEFDGMVNALHLPDVAAQRAWFTEQERRLKPTPPSALLMVVHSAFGRRERVSRMMGEAMVGLFLPAVQQARNAEWRAVSRDRVRLAGFALAAYREDHGALPGSLSALVPDLLPEIPLDPWTGKELIYRQTDDGALVYSVDLDLADDGGVPVDVKAGRPQGDIVIHVAAE